MQDGGRYTAKSEVNKQAFGEAMKRSLSRPLSESFFARGGMRLMIVFLALEPVVLFFAIWAALAVSHP
jgi:hypothetical protein